MYEEEIVLCGASAYNKKYYLNQNFLELPKTIQEELRILCVLFTEDVGGILQLVFDEDGHLEFRVSYDEGDLLYDEIGSALKIKQYRNTKRELLEQVELYYRVVFLGEGFEEDE